MDSHFPHQTGADQIASSPAVLHGLMGVHMQELKCALRVHFPKPAEFFGSKEKKILHTVYYIY